MNRNPTTDRLFSYSANTYVGYGICLIVIFAPLLILSFVPVFDPFLTTISMIAIASGLYIIFKALKFRVRFAEFFPELFKIRGPKFSKEFSYSQIDDIILVKGILSGASITISVIGEEEPLVFFKNPKNPSEDTDLYSWLKRRSRKGSV